MKEASIIHFENNWGYFIGSLSDNLAHQHYAVQLSISLNSQIIIHDENNTSYSFEHFIIRSNSIHRLECKGDQLLILLNPSSSIGHYLSLITKNEVSEFIKPIANRLAQLAKDFIEGKSKFKQLSDEISTELREFSCECEKENHFGDERIKRAIQYLEEHFQRIIPVEEIAEICHLSPSRFLHLFKEKTGITYRKVQQWNKLSQSIKMLPNQSLTQTAHQFGFTDSSHYSKSFKESFGMSPKYLKR